MSPHEKSTAEEPTISATLKQAMRGNRRWLFGLLGLALAWHALRGVAWGEAWGLLAGMGPLAILTIAAVNLLLLPLMTARWWLLLRTLGSPVGLLPLCAYRTAANAISYLTPGPHFGGEPLSIYLLTHRQGRSLSAASTSVVVDRLLELLASFIVLTLSLGILAFTESDLFTGSQGLFFVIAVLALFTWVLSALFTGRRPFSRAVFLLKRLCPLMPWTNGKLMELIVQGEIMAESLFRGHRQQFLFANLFSLAHWLGVFAEFWLISVFLGFPLSLWHLTAVVVVARLAFFTPLPAGIGVLESALPWVTAALGLGSTLGLSLCLIIRFRDLLFTLVGIGFATKYLTCRRKAVIISAKLAEPVTNDP
jgi:uncharacterized protein (TIRG00374 family)